MIMYCNMNSCIRRLSVRNIINEQIAILNNLRTYLSVKSRSHDINGFTLNEVNDILKYL